MTVQQFRLPDVGEGLEEAEIVIWHVAVGDTVTHNQILVEIETAKSLVELPAPFEGTVLELLVPEGETVAVGTVLIAIDSTADPVGDGSPQAPGASSAPGRTPPLHTPTDAATEDPGASEPVPSVLVGYGPTEGSSTRRRRKAEGKAPTAVSSGTPANGGTVGNSSSGTTTRAKPPVRKLGKDLGVDLATVIGSGPHGRVTRDDVLRHVNSGQARPSEVGSATPVDEPPAGRSPSVPAAASEQAESLTTRIRVKGVRKVTASAMSASAFTAPHVTEFVTVDVTRSVKLVEKLKTEQALAGSRVTMMLLVARALLAAIREFPHVNAAWDGEADEIVLHHRVNLGIAAATPRGLIVPNIKNAAALTLPGLAAALTELVRNARDGKCTLEDMSHGTITITNIGVFGVDTGTPILNPGEAAILCVGAVRRTPWEYKGEVALRWTTQLALSFDHRLVDGELGSKVLARVGQILQNPKWELLLS